MANRPTKKSTRQAPAAAPRTATVELPLPLLAALEGAESGFLGLCIEAGKQVQPRGSRSAPRPPQGAPVVARARHEGTGVARAPRRVFQWLRMG